MFATDYFLLDLCCCRMAFAVDSEQAGAPSLGERVVRVECGGPTMVEALRALAPGGVIEIARDEPALLERARLLYKGR